VEERYYPASVTMEKAGENRLLVHNENDNSNHIIPQLLGTILLQLAGSLTIEEHIESIRSNAIGIGLSKSLLYDIAKEWVSHGLLRSENLIMAGSKKSSSNKAPFFSGCITCNRPKMIDRWLNTRTLSQSYSSNKINILISDDSRDKKIIENNKLIAEKHSNGYSGKIKLINRVHRENYSNLLHIASNKKISKDIIDFAININTPNYNAATMGSNQNSLILGSAGSILLSNDDDIEYKAYSLRDNKEKEVVFCDNYVSPVFFYPNMEQLDFNTQELGNYNLPEICRDFLNSSLNKYLATPDALSIISPKTAILLEKELIGILAVVGGYRGARWHQKSYRSIVEPQHNMEQYFYNFDDYSSIKKNGINFTASEKTIFNNGSFFMGGTYCIDNSNILPPVFPIGTFNDSIFGVLFNRCLGPAFSVLLPVAFFHNPEIKKEFSENDFNDVSMGIGNYCFILANKFTESFVTKDSKGRLQETGYRFEELGKLSLADFEEYLKLIQLEYISQMMNHIDAIKEFYSEGPAWWQEDMIKCYTLLKDEAEKKDTVVPVELRSLNNKEKALSLFQEYLKKYGILLQLWPDIWELSRQLNIEGKGLFGTV